MHSQRLSELGIELPPVAAPVAAYVPAVRSGDHVYTSGQLPFVDGQLPATGKVGADVDPDQATELARIAALNAVAAAADLVGLDNIEQVVKVNGFVASAQDFGGQPGVINGASTVLQEIFADAGVHARAAVGVAELPLNSPVEVDIVVRVRD
ncbi:MULTISPECIES: RidA family protein [Corynebacterium]|uniref:RidA family protein n=1 Tax=Corynebacterium TaxID=1716 RepID=UPI000C081166|nr:MULTISPECIES: RidA family protein [Corynebacterium]MBF0581609.1 RidA family protein [Corynebacterium sp. ED61]